MSAKLIHWLSQFSIRKFGGEFINPREESALAACASLMLASQSDFYDRPMPFVDIPEEISKLQALTDLTISCQKLSGVEYLKTNRKLTKISLLNVEVIPSEILEIESLEELNLTNCGDFKPIDIDSRLKHLSVSLDNPDSADFYRLSSFMGRIESLESLSINCRYPRLDIPFSLGNFKYLKHLSVGNWYWREFSGELFPIEINGLDDIIRPLTSLQTIRLLSIRTVDCEMILANNKSLTKVELIDCGLREVPESVGQLNDLELLDIRENGIDVVPKWLQKVKVVKI